VSGAALESFPREKRYDLGLEAVRPVPSFPELFRAHLPYVLRVLRYLGAPASDVEDLAQEVFLTVHRKLPAYEGRGRITTWLFAICGGAVRDHRKRAHRRHEQPEASPPDAAAEPTQESELEFRRALATLEDVLAGVDEDQRLTFLLYEVEELTMKEIAEAMGCPIQTGYTRLRAARAHVIERMRKRGAT
jgi:RNA polymerase sigma-70 factor (ECF subfamily)